ncbi:hypothetical protein HDU67_007392 [Dinochytrium kinnereticum]|nr:hypothetical protein HDU67_007392 [Dinochytrium kinnereticum]
MTVKETHAVDISAAWPTPADHEDANETTYFVESEEFLTLETALIQSVDTALTSLMAHAALVASATDPTKVPPTPKFKVPEEEGDESFDEKQNPATRLKAILNKYREIPHLLDQHLEKMVTPAVEYLRGTMATVEEIQQPDLKKLSCRILLPIYRLLYRICNVRGEKTVVRFLTHEAADLEPTLLHLASIPDTFNLWSIRYMILIWLSLIVMIPFNLSTIDSTHVDGVDEGQGIVVRLVDLCKGYLGKPGKESEAAAILLARLLTRKDTVDVHLPTYVSWCSANLNNDDTAVVLQVAILHSLCQIHKLGPRQLLLPNLDSLLGICTRMVIGKTAKSNSLIRKLITKLCQRVGLCYLKPKVAKWRYQRGSRSLSMNLKVLGTNISNPQPAVPVTAAEEEDDDLVPAEIEEVVETLLLGLRDKDTIVRWSAAKGIGRIASRLTEEFATEVVRSVIALFHEDVVGADEVGGGGDNVDISGTSDHTWHGACLAVAELARRGLIMPTVFGDVMYWNFLSLHFDLRKGTYSVGSQVRDAACYVCWSLVRAYDAKVLFPYINQLAGRLVLIATLDREVNVRRAAAAALQECVGRLGSRIAEGEEGVADGIELVTMADYFSVGNRGGAGEIAVEIARKFPTYRSQIIKHVSTVMIVHWDKEMRELASKILGKLTVVDPRDVVGNFLGKLVDMATSSDLIIRHGAILSIAEIFLSLSKLSLTDEKPWWINTLLSTHMMLAPLQSVAKLIQTFPTQYLDSFGSDQTLIALTHLIQCLCKANFPTHNELPPIPSETSSTWQTLLKTCLTRPEESIQNAAAVAYGGYLSYLFTKISLGVLGGDVAEELRVVCLGAGRGIRGWNLVMMEVPVLVMCGVEGGVGKVVGCLGGVLCGGGGGRDADVRRIAVLAVARIVGGVVEGGFAPTHLPPLLLQKILDQLLTSAEDYSTDQRGDVGSWVREACFRAWTQIIPSLVRNGCVEMEMCERVVVKLVRHCVEKIDRVREAAGVALRGICGERDGEGWLILGRGVDGVRERVLRTSDWMNPRVNWLNPGEVYPLMTPLLENETLRSSLLLGLVVSVGGISESLVRQSTSSLVSFLNGLPVVATTSAPTVTLPEVLDSFLGLFEDENLPMGRETRERVSLSLLEVADVLVGCGAVLRAVEGCGWARGGVGVFERCKKEVFKSKDVKKIVSAIKVYGGLATLPGESARTVRERSLSACVTYLAHPFPRVRRAASETVYLIVSTTEREEGGGGEEEEERVAEAEEVLLCTDWDLPVDQVRGVRQQVADLLGVKLAIVPAGVKK